jgi:hypothetical protein
VGIRRLATARIHQQMTDLMPYREIRTRYEPHRNTAVVRVRLSPWWYLTLGLWHARIWWKARRQVLESAADVQSDIRVEVKWPTRKI